MAYKVRVTDEAEYDLDEILSYIAGDLEKPKAATAFADELNEKYKKLADQPLMFEYSRNPQLRQKGYRRFIIGGYVTLYLVDESRSAVNIARIFYGKREYEKYI